MPWALTAWLSWGSRNQRAAQVEHSASLRSVEDTFAAKMCPLPRAAVPFSLRGNAGLCINGEHSCCFRKLLLQHCFHMAGVTCTCTRTLAGMHVWVACVQSVPLYPATCCGPQQLLSRVASLELLCVPVMECACRLEGCVARYRMHMLAHLVTTPVWHLIAHTSLLLNRQERRQTCCSVQLIQRKKLVAMLSNQYNCSNDVVDFSWMQHVAEVHPDPSRLDPGASIRRKLVQIMKGGCL
jgi:hypothetical protein